MWILSSRISLLRQCPISSRHFSSHTVSIPRGEVRQRSKLNSCIEGTSSLNSRLENLKLTAAFYGSPGPLLELPSLPKTVPLIDPSPQTVLKGDPERKEEVVQDPSITKTEIKDPGKQITKWAHRMIRIKKRKMKVHQRKKRWRKNKVFYQTRIFNRIKSREIAFRTALLDKIQVAESFDARTYVQDYLEKFKTPLTPLTYEGRRLPVWLIKELLIEDELKKKRAIDLQLNTLSKKPLIKKGETVEDFVKRITPEIDIYKM